MHFKDALNRTCTNSARNKLGPPKYNHRHLSWCPILSWVIQRKTTLFQKYIKLAASTSYCHHNTSSQVQLLARKTILWNIVLTKMVPFDGIEKRVMLRNPAGNTKWSYGTRRRKVRTTHALPIGMVNTKKTEQGQARTSKELYVWWDK